MKALLRAVRPYWVFWALTVVWFVAYLPALGSVFDEWSVLGYGHYGHGLLVLAVSIFFMWEDRKSLASPQLTIRPLPLMACASASLLWWLGEVSNTLVVEQIALAFLYHSLIWAAFGFSVYRKNFSALTLVIFALPIWGFLQDPLRQLSSLVTYHLLEILNYPFFYSDYLFTLPGGSFIVELACSGLSFLLVALVLGWVYCKMHGVVGLQKVGLMLVSISFAIVANWIRIFLIMVVGDKTNMQHFIVQDHLTFGWVVYMVMLLPYFYIAGKFTTVEERAAGDAALDNESHASESFRMQQAKSLPVLLFVMAALPAWNAFQNLTAPSISSTAGPLATMIASSSLYHGEVLSQVSGDSLSWAPKFIGADKREMYRLSNSIEVYVASYYSQTQGKELIFHKNRIYDAKRWKTGIQDKSFKLEPSLNIQQQFISRGNESRILLSWYDIAGLKTSNAKLAKIYEAYSALTADKRSSVFIVSVDISNASESQLEKTLEIIDLLYRG